MMIKASGRSALILATGLFVCFAGPSPVAAASSDSAAAASKSDSATPGKSIGHSARYWKRYAQRRSGKVASKSTETRKGADKTGTDVAGNSAPAIPASVANANAQLASADAPDSVSAMTAKANTMLLAAADKPADAAEAPADTAVVAPDQLNEGDRSLHPSSQTVAMASPKPAADGAAQAANSDSTTLDKTSLIGKIFIAFGALLTLASAARMFMA